LGLNFMSIPTLVSGLMVARVGMEVKKGLHTTEAKWFMIESQRHSYHLVDPSPWHISGSLGALATTVGGVMYMHSFQGGARLLSLGLIFILYTMFDGMEYYQAPFTISDSIYGSTFFLATGFHGFHVIIGTLFLIICGIRQYLAPLTKEHHVGFEAAAWYWHFVDVVWLFPFVSIYWWGGIEEIMADHVHQEMTRNLILVYLILFFLIVIKDVFLSLVSFMNKLKNLMDLNSG
ncbi:hypothetical protein E1A91_D04G112300v1, partial [Gossypium mustelinum]